MISVNRLMQRRSDFSVRNWIMDSGAFTRISNGKEHIPVKDYGDLILRWSECGNLQAAVSQDYMCESFVLDITGMSVRQHQVLTYARYKDLLRLKLPTYIMPVIQGYHPDEYVKHIKMYGKALHQNAWVGVGSVCKRNGNPVQVAKVLRAIKSVRPDLNLHCFGIKLTALKSQICNSMIYSCDSMAWSYNARRDGLKSSDIGVAKAYEERIAGLPIQFELPIGD